MSEASYFDGVLDEQAANEPPVLDAQVEEVDEVSVEEESILTHGYFTTTVELGTNKVIIRTLKLGEELEVALATKKYQDTIEATRALIAATIGTSIVSVNGRPLIPYALGQKDESVEAKFNYVTENFYWATIRALYDEYTKLVQESLDTAESIKKN